MKKYDIIVAGAGFAGIYAAWRLARSGLKVALIEASDKLGGVLYSQEWNGFFLDNGTHNFDMRTPKGEDFYSDILQENIIINKNHNWASTTGKTWSMGFEMPDYSIDNPTLAAKALAELKDLQKQPPTDTPIKYMDWYRQNYGKTLAEKAASILKKVSGSDPEEIAYDGRGSLGMISRPKLGSDAEMIALKSSDSFWDDRIGVTINSNANEYAGKNENVKFGYPAKQGLRGFCLSAHKRLLEMGVDIFLNEPIQSLEDGKDHVIVKTNASHFTAEKVFWSMPEFVLAKILNIDVDLMSSAIPVGNSFFAFEVLEKDILGPSYLQDFSTTRIAYRYNKAGLFSNQVKSDGYSYVTAEVPCHPANIKQAVSEANQKLAWDGLIDTGFVKKDTAARSAHMWGFPVAFSLPKVDWRKSYDDAQIQIKQRSERIVGIDFGYRGRLKFMNFYDDILEQKLLEPAP